MSPMESVMRAKDKNTRIGMEQAAMNPPSKMAATGRSLTNFLAGLTAGPTKFVTLVPISKKHV